MQIQPFRVVTEVGFEEPDGQTGSRISETRHLTHGAAEQAAQWSKDTIHGMAAFQSSSDRHAARKYGGEIIGYYRVESVRIEVAEWFGSVFSRQKNEVFFERDSLSKTD